MAQGSQEQTTFKWSAFYKETSLSLSNIFKWLFCAHRRREQVCCQCTGQIRNELATADFLNLNILKIYIGIYIEHTGIWTESKWHAEH